MAALRGKKAAAVLEKDISFGYEGRCSATSTRRSTPRRSTTALPASCPRPFSYVGGPGRARHHGRRYPHDVRDDGRRRRCREPRVSGNGGCDMARALNLINSDEPFFGHRHAPGAAARFAVRIALKVLEDRAIAILPAGCMSAVGFNFPQLAFGCNAMISTFAGTASLMTGVAAGMKRKRRDGLHGGRLRGRRRHGRHRPGGAVWRHRPQRRHPVRLLRQRGVHEHGHPAELAPRTGASTTTSPVDRNGRRRSRRKKGTCSASLWRWGALMWRPRAWGTWTITRRRSRRRAISTERSSSTCSLHARPGGEARSTRRWSSREAVDCGLWRLAECEGGVVTVNRDPRKKTGEFARSSTHHLAAALQAHERRGHPPGRSASRRPMVLAIPAR